MPALKRLSSHIHALRLFVYRKLPTRVFLSIAVLVSTATVWVPTCADAQGLSITNSLNQPVSVWISGNHDPTNRIDDWQPNHRVHVDRVLAPEERATFANQVYPEYRFVVIEARAVTGTPWDPNAPLLFVRMFTPEQLKAARWLIAVEPGYEQPTWGEPPHDLTVRNDFAFTVFVRVYLARDEMATDVLWPVAFYLQPEESRLLRDAIRGQMRFFTVSAEIQGDGRQVFSKRFTREQLSAVNWTIAVEPSHEKPDW